MSWDSLRDNLVYPLIVSVLGAGGALCFSKVRKKAKSIAKEFIGFLSIKADVPIWMVVCPPILFVALSLVLPGVMSVLISCILPVTVLVIYQKLQPVSDWNDYTLDSFDGLTSQWSYDKGAIIDIRFHCPKDFTELMRQDSGYREFLYTCPTCNWRSREFDSPRVHRQSIQNRIKQKINTGEWRKVVEHQRSQAA